MTMTTMRARAVCNKCRIWRVCSSCYFDNRLMNQSSNCFKSHLSAENYLYTTQSQTIFHHMMMSKKVIKRRQIALLSVHVTHRGTQNTTGHVGSIYSRTLFNLFDIMRYSQWTLTDLLVCEIFLCAAASYWTNNTLTEPRAVPAWLRLMKLA